MTYPTYSKDKKFTEHFWYWEMECRCGCGEVNMNPGTMELLEAVRAHLDAPLRVDSGARCRSHNKKIGGVQSSSHISITGNGIDTQCHAVDIECRDDVYRAQLVPALCMQFHRVYIYPRHIHVDNDPQKPQNRLGVRQYPSTQ